MAKGEPSTAEKAAHCPGCAEAFKTDGFCTACNGGFVAGRAYMNQGDHDAAKAAHTTLTTAAEKAAKCEHCAVAMVNNGTCEKCKVSYKDGQPAKM